MTKGDSFKRVLKGGGAFSVGSFAAAGLQFTFGVFVVRLVSQQQYGWISVGYLVANIMVTLATWGFGSSLPRFLANSRERAPQATGAVAGIALTWVLLTSALLAALMYFGAAKLGVEFGKPELAPTLKAFALLVPPLVLIHIFSALFRGVETAKPKVLFQDLSLNIARLLLLIPVVGLHGGYHGIVAVYIGSVWMVAAAYSVYAWRRFMVQYPMSIDWRTAGPLLSFSFPLMGAAIAASLMNWAGVLSVGYFQSAQEVARFNAPMRLANLLPLALTAIAFLYLPVASRLIGERRTDEMRALYRSATKWAFMLSLPLLLFLLLSARPLVTALFGADYASAAAILCVLAVGKAINVFAGPSGMTLIAYGDSRAVFTAAILSGLAAVGLCVALVPAYGALGAAWAVATARGVSNAYVSLRLKLRYDIHPFGADYLKPLLFVSALGYCGGWILLHLLGSGWWVQALLFVLLVSLAVVAPVVTRAVAAEDVELVAALERRLFSRMRIAPWLEGRCCAHTPTVGGAACVEIRSKFPKSGQ